MYLVVAEDHPPGLVLCHIARSVALLLESPHATKHFGRLGARDETKNAARYKRVKLNLHCSTPLLLLRTRHGLRVGRIVVIRDAFGEGSISNDIAVVFKRPLSPDRKGGDGSRTCRRGSSGC